MRRVFGFIVNSALLAAFPAVAGACSCTDVKPTDSPVIIVVKVEDERPPDLGPPSRQVIGNAIRLSLVRVVKGSFLIKGILFTHFGSLCEPTGNIGDEFEVRLKSSDASAFEMKVCNSKRLVARNSVDAGSKTAPSPPSVPNGT